MRRTTREIHTSLAMSGLWAGHMSGRCPGLVWYLEGNNNIPASTCPPFLSHCISDAERDSMIETGRSSMSFRKGFSNACCAWHPPLVSLRKLLQWGPYQPSWVALGPSTSLDFAVPLTACVFTLDLPVFVSALWRRSKSSGSGIQGWPFFLWWSFKTSLGFKGIKLVWSN